MESKQDLTLFARIFRTKSPDQMVSDAKKNGLKRTLGAMDLTVLGIGAIIGAGIFTLSGTAAAGSAGHVGAGPALMLSFVVAGIACALAALCYAEFAAMIPVAGSAYTYTFATLGEIAAWLIGWILLLEYAIGNITVACGWSGYLFQLLNVMQNAKVFVPFTKIYLFTLHLPEWLVNPPVWLVHDYHTAITKLQHMGVQNPESHIPHILGIPFAVNLPALFIIAVVVAFLYRGIQESTKMAGTMVAIKMFVILLFIGAGAFYVQPGNWQPFVPNGFHSIFVGAFLVFFAYIGFDAVSTAAEETKNPQKDLPIGIIASLAVCTLLYILVAAVLTGMVPWKLIDTHAPIAAAMSYVKSPIASTIASLIAVGAVAGLTSVLLVMQMGATRIMFAMSRDKLLPPVFSKVHPKYKSPHVVTVLSGLFVAIGTIFLDLNAAAELCNIGTIVAFLIVCTGVLVLRKVDPHRERPFKVPFAPFTPILGVILCLVLIYLGVPTRTLILFAGWIGIGLIIYFAYGYRKTGEVTTSEVTDILTTEEQPLEN